MKKIIKLNEQDLERLVKKVIAEEENSSQGKTPEKKTTMTKITSLTWLWLWK
jgi:hypothetical protein